MLSRAHRFHGLGALNFAYKQGQQVRGSQISLRYALNKRRQMYRVAVVVSKKVSKSAVVRNRIRRRLYGALPEMITSIEPYDLIFTVHNDQILSLAAPELQRTVAGQLQRAGVLTVVSSTERML